MAKENIKSKKGFTIIEVVLVLAIAGLIFLMVFVALPALQRSQRDTQRRQDYADLLAAMNSYITNNNGTLPIDNTSLSAKEYINATGNGPSGNSYTINVCTYAADTCPKATWATTDEATNQQEGNPVWIVKEATCSEGTVIKSNSKKAFAIYADLETGTYCQSSN